MVLTRSGGNNSFSECSTSNSLQKLKDKSIKHENAKDDETRHLISTRKSNRVSSKLHTNSSINTQDGHFEEDNFVRSNRRSSANFPICKSTPKPISSDRSYTYRSSFRRTSIDNDSSKKRKIDDISHSRSLRSLGLEEEVSSCEDDDGIGALATTRHSRKTARDKFPAMLLRRSDRQKKTVYSTLNMSTLEHAAILNEELDSTITRKKKRSINPELRDLLLAQGKDPEQLESFMQPDIYNSIKSRKRLRRPRRFFDEMTTSVHSEHALSDQSRNDEDEDEDEVEVEEDQKNNNGENADEDENDDEEDEIEQETTRKYSLRTKRAQPLRLVYEIQRQSRQPRGLFDHLASSPAHRKRSRFRGTNPASPYQHRQRRTNSQGASSTSSSDSDADERRFQNRKKKSMSKARNRCLPLNLTLNDLATHSYAKDRRKVGSSLADVDPMNIDKSVKFTSIGGHRKHIQALKEMVVFPLLYPEVFQKFHINPPRGCLFYGPPGNGKTLMARALANECSNEGKKVAFFMRKGADCLSKWVGESERQLRLLFDQAYQMRPSIIFFDEIDGLAPVRSSRQDQIHSSIVSTLLGLMDGLDNRGEIIVIGATNRIDSIDPALRRPGRFDREFRFPPPDKETRCEILKIHTQKWTPPLSDAFIDDLAEKTTGYCGADIMTLCAESALVALRRRYPQIYSTEEKLKLDVNSIDIQAVDFYKAMKTIVPSAQRSDASPASPLNTVIRPLLTNSLKEVLKRLVNLFPLVEKKSKIIKISSPNVFLSSNANDDRPVDESESEFDDDVTPAMLPLPVNGISIPETHLYDLSSHTYRQSTICRPRLLIHGKAGDGHTSHLAPAVLYDLEGMPVHLLDVPTLYGVSVRNPEEACAQIFREARRTAPSIIYMPNANKWWELASPTLQHTFETLLASLPAWSKVLILATCDRFSDNDDDSISKFFSKEHDEYYETTPVSYQERLIFFAPIYLHFAKKPPIHKKIRKVESLEVLPKAAPKVSELTEKELAKIELAEESTMRSLRLFLRDVLTRLAQDRRFKIFLKPVDTDEVPDYTDVIAKPMDISTMMNKIDQHQYNNVASFADDINLICSNALEYNPDHCAEDRAIRHRACLLKDIAHAIIEDDLDPDFEKLCNDVIESRRKRKANPLKFAPKYYKVLPKSQSVDDMTGMINVSNTPWAAKENAAAAKSMKTAVRKRRRRTAWATGIIKKAKKFPKTAKVKQAVENNNQDIPDKVEEDIELEEKDNINTANDSMISSVEEVTLDNDTSAVSVPDQSSDHSRLFDSLTVNPADSFLNGSCLSTEDIEQTTITEEVVANDHQICSVVSTDNTPGRVDDNILENETKVECELEPINNIISCPEIDKQLASIEHVKSSTQESNALVTSSKLISNETEFGSIAIVENANDGEKSPQQDIDELHCRMILRSQTKSVKDVNVDVIELPPFIVDEQKLKDLLHETVKKTMSLSVDQLERIYSGLIRCCHRHRHDFDKTKLIQDLERVVNRMSSTLSIGIEIQE